MKIQVDFLFINTQLMVQIDSYYCLNQFGGLFRDVTPLSSKYTDAQTVSDQLKSQREGSRV